MDIVEAWNGERLVLAAQDQATNSEISAKVDITVRQILFVDYVKKVDETISHVMCECEKSITRRH